MSCTLIISALQGNRDRRGPYKKNVAATSLQLMPSSMTSSECEPGQFFEALAAMYA